ncbi:MAG: DegT/DnrJ/EryC1/StrS family aminotransferase [Bacteroidetes bacterium]|nr:DegT/DnrJ/EryC1/StrS family aminotransferase [Bacteroidota bacterium]
MQTIPIFNTHINPNAFELVKETLYGTFLSEGNIVKKFEEQLNKQLGLINITTLNSGTSALHLALDLANVKEGDEVICPAQTFVASALVIIQQRAKPVFADIDYETGNISVTSIKNKITPKTKAIMAVHWGGYPCDMDEINAIAKENNLIVIEDAAHALGAIYKNKPVGTISDYTCFSFQAIKHLTTGDGGAITVKSNQKYKEAVTKRWFGIDRENAAPSELGERMYDIKQLGYKYHLNNYAAALGIANLTDFKIRMERRLKIAKLYDEKLTNISGIKLFNYKFDRRSAYWLYGMHVEKRLDFIRALKEKGITASVIHQRIDRNNVFGGMCNDLQNQAKFEETQIHIPIHDAVNEDAAEYIIDSIKQGW